jgi:hypothetical protein
MSGPVAHDDFVDLLEELSRAGCDFVVVGAHALAAHGIARATGDLDVFVRPDGANAVAVVRALQSFGAPLEAHGVSAQDFASPGAVYQLGLPPRRIDLLTQISGVAFDEALHGHVVAHVGRVSVRCIGLEAMIRNKRAAGRPKDLVDVDALVEILERRSRP